VTHNPNGFAVLVDPALEEPVYVQVARQIREAIASGAIPPGAVLPSVRALGSDLGVNLNTIARAYRVLEEDGFVEIETRSGVRVMPPGAHASPQKRAQLNGELRAVLVRMRQAGLSPRELRRAVLLQIVALSAPHRP
jgi:DNA-binding transcriptional regulator YhcF (GntR family)